MPIVKTKRAAIVAVVAAAAVTGVLAATATVPAGAATATCATNVYKVVWPHAGVYNQPSHGSYRIMTKTSGDRVTGPTDWGHVWNDGYRWTKVWVYSDPNWREGWMRDDAATFIRCD